jgi:hypothetical protein
MSANRPYRPSADHASHDQLLIARAASDDDLTGAEQATVAQRLSTCSDCAILHADLLALTAGLRTDLPTPRRPRDFRLSPEIAARPSWRERLGGAFLGRSLQPLAAAVCALGLFLAVTGAVLPRAGSAATLSDAGSAVTGAGAPAALPGQPVPQAAGSPAASAKGGGSNSTGVAGAGPSAVDVDPGSLQPRPTPPGGAFGSVPSGGAGDVALGPVPPATEKAAAPGGPDPTTLLIAGGLLMFAAGGGGLLLLRRRSS